MTHRPLRKSQLLAFDHAVAGHDGVLSDKSGDLIVKPCKEVEIDFYQTINSHPQFARFVPLFIGELSLSQDVSEAAPSRASNIKSHRSQPSNSSLLGPNSSSTRGTSPQAWTPSAGAQLVTDCAIVLENVTSGLRKPNTLDVKLGARLWADDAPRAKREKLDQRASVTTSKPLGFRIAGMKTWMGPSSAGQTGVGLDGYKKYGKEYGRGLTVDTVRESLEAYFFNESAGVTRKLGKKVIDRFLQDLRDLQAVLEREESRMYSASLLFVYEGDGAGLEADLETIKQLAEMEAGREAGKQPLAYGTPINGVLRAKNRAGHDEEGICITAPVEDVNVEEDDDGDLDSEDEFMPPKIQAVKVIDFAHAAWTPGQGPDENFLHGLRNVIKILEEISR